MIEKLRLFLQLKCNINAKDDYDDTPFHYACSNSSVDLSTINFFITNNCDFYSHNKYGETPAYRVLGNYKLKANLENHFGKIIKTEEDVIDLFKNWDYKLDEKEFD